MSRFRGVMTVEAAFVLPICIFAVITVLYINFYMGNVASATGVAEEVLAKHGMCSHVTVTDFPRIREEIYSRLSETLAGAGDLVVDCNLKNDCLKTSIRGNVKIPVGFAVELPFEVKDEIRILDQTEFVRDVRRVANIIGK
ncbi:MAG: hypothetical protein E7241_03810 [Lachnospiraceae bacterium]|nr:hypothetical protein [Lachnospiraceae bacterium]